MSRYTQTGPTTATTTVSSFGGPEDMESGQDDGSFAFGGRSENDGEINPEFYAAFPAELYDKGVVQPGGIYTVTNPETGVKIPVVARDKGPSAKNRGLDLAPHAMAALGADTDKHLEVDFTQVGSAPKVGTGPSAAVAPEAAPMGLQGIDTSALSLGPDVPASPSGPAAGTNNLAGVKVLSPIDRSIYGGDIDPETGEQLSPDDDYDDSTKPASPAGEVPAQVSNNLLAQAAAAKPVSKRPDGSVVFDNGLVYHPDGSIEQGGVLFTQGPDGKMYHRNIPNPKDPPIHMIKDENGLAMPYTMKDGKLTRVPLEGELPPDQIKIPEGATGEDALVNLSPEDKARVKSFANNALPPPMSGRPNPMFNKLFPYILAYKPDYSTQDYAGAQQLKKQFLSSNPSVAGGQINSVNTAIDHLGELYDLSQKLDNSKFKKYNSIRNYLESETGDPNVAAYKESANKVGLELDRAFRGGVATAGGEKHAMEALSAANSPEQLRAVLTQVLPNMLNQRLGEIGYPYEQTFGKPFEALTRPSSERVMKKFGIHDFGQTEAKTPATTAAPSAPAAAAPQAPKAQQDPLVAQALVEAHALANDPSAPPLKREQAQALIKKYGGQ